MDVNQPLQLLGGLSPQLFMKRHWQKKPLLVRQAIPDFKPLLKRRELFELAARPDGQARMVIQTPGQAPGWQLKNGPFERRSLPPLKRPGWTLLVQGVDLLDDGVHALMNRFRFVPDARIDDVMISYATDGGGVGPHFDSYDVFLLQAHGRRRWRIGRQTDRRLQPDVPLKILTNFAPDQEFVLEPGDMLYLPLLHAHDGIAVGECMTYSIGFRSPGRAELGRELLQRLSDDALEVLGDSVYRDPHQVAVNHAGDIPQQLLDFAQSALHDALHDRQALARVLGEYLTEPKASIWFDSTTPANRRAQGQQQRPVQLDRRTKMMFDARHIFINGESFRASGRDATLMRRLADERCLEPADWGRLSAQALSLLQEWEKAGWLHGL